MIRMEIGEGYGLGFNLPYHDRARRVPALNSELNVFRIALVSHLPRQMVLQSYCAALRLCPGGKEWYRSFMREKPVNLLNTLVVSKDGAML